MKTLRIVDMAWSVVTQRELTVAVLKDANIDVPEVIDDESLLTIVKDNISIESVNLGIWRIAKTNPSIKHCLHCAHLLEPE